MTRSIHIIFLIVAFYCCLLVNPIVVRADEGIGTETLQNKECVILLHGLGRTYRAMQELADELEADGFSVANVDYPSTDFDAVKLAEQALPEGIEKCRAQGATTIHVVTHSLGGILTRYYLQTQELAELGRVVMLSPPNQGSEIPDNFGDTFLFNFVMGPVFSQLRTAEDSFVNSLGPVTYPLGVITGNKSLFFDHYFSKIIPGEDDGKVSVERAKVEGMTDFIVLPYTHPYIMKEEEVIQQTIHFLRSGMFNHND